MFSYRLTKYDPSRRDDDDRFLDEEWTSVSDIGRAISGKTLTTVEYLRSEDAYVQASKTLLLASRINSMRVTDLEIRCIEFTYIDDGIIAACQKLQNDMIVSGIGLENVIRGCLREHTWCRLHGLHGAYIHFGYDCYMYLGLPDRAKLTQLPCGMYLEEYASPYSRLD